MKSAFVAPCGTVHDDLFIIYFFDVIIIKIEHSIVSVYKGWAYSVVYFTGWIDYMVLFCGIIQNLG